MFGEKHDIPHEFPEFQVDIEALKQQDPMFSEAYNEYHLLDEEIRQIEQNVETVSDVYAEELKKKRVVLKDQIYEALRKHHATV